MIWELALGQTHWQRLGGMGIHNAHFCFLPGSHTLVTSGDQNIGFLDTDTWENRSGTVPGRYLEHLTVSPDGKFLLTFIYDEAPVVWDLGTGRQHLTSPCSPERGPALCAAFSPDSRFVVAGCHRGVIRRWDLASKEELEFWQAPEDSNRGVQAVAFSPDGRFLATLHDEEERNLLLWETTRGEIRTTLTLKRKRYYPLEGLNLIAFSPDGRTFVGSELRSVLRFWDVESGRERVILSSTPHREILCLAFSPDGRWLVEGGDWGHVKLWPVRALLDALPISG
jgi:WD40 repeat protein